MSIRRVIKKCEIPNPDGTDSTWAERQLATEDLLPVPPHKRLWTGLSFVSFWIADSFNINTFAIASSGVVLGLSWWNCLIATALGYTLAAPFLVLNGRPGAMHHIKFPAVARTSFGLFGSYWPVLNRVVMSCVWWGVQAWIGGQCVAVLLRAMAPSYNNIPNGMEGSGTTTQAWLGFFIFWLMSLLTIYPPIEKARYFFHAKAIIAPAGGIAFLAWALVKSGGGGDLLRQKATLSGGAAVFPTITTIMSAISNMATLITNNPDITSYAAKPSSAVWPQLITLPLGFIITSFIGIIIASCSQTITGKVIWDPIEHLGTYLDGDVSSGTRAGVAFIAICFIYTQLILNLSANSIGAGCDMTALLPKWINIRRGSYICAFAGLAYCPWNLFSSSNAFTSYLGAYSVFLSSIAGVMLCEYYLVRKGHFRVTDLYTNHSKGWYIYTKGWNFRAFAAYIMGLVPNFPGFVNSIISASGGKKPIGEGADKIFAFNWFVGIAVSMGTYYLLNKLYPPPGAFPPGKFYEIDESEYEEYGLANMPKFYDSPVPSQEVSDDKKDYVGSKSNVYEVPELR